MYKLEERDKLPLKQFNLIVTGTNWTQGTCRGTFYQDLGGTWFADITIMGTLSAGSGNFDVTVAGVTFSGVEVAYLQPLTVTFNSTTAIGSAFTSIGDSKVYFRGTSATVFKFQGRVELEGKPDFME